MIALHRLTRVGRLVPVSSCYRPLSVAAGGKAQWDAVLKRGAEILVEVTDKQPSLVLHIYPDEQFLNNLDKVSQDSSENGVVLLPFLSMSTAHQLRN